MADALHSRITVGFNQMESLRRRDGNKAGRLVGIEKSLDHHIQIDVGQSVYVIGQENLLIPDVLTDGEEALAYKGLGTSIGECNPPVREVGAEQFYVSTAFGKDKITRQRFIVVKEKPLNSLAFMTEAQDKILVAIMRVILHQVPHNWGIPDGDQRLRNIFGVLPQPQTQTATENYNLHNLTPSCQGLERKSGTHLSLQQTTSQTKMA